MAVAILALGDPSLAEALRSHRAAMIKDVAAADTRVKEQTRRQR